MKNSKKKILVLSTLDERGLGHGWSNYELFKSLGYTTDYICLLRTQQDTKKYVIDKVNPFNLKYFAYLLIQNLSKVLFYPYLNMRFWYKGINFANSKTIIKKMDFVPDYIVICTFNFFLSPKALYEIWKATGAKFVFCMVDNKILTGGCPYPINCCEYENGCKRCPQYRYASFIPRRIMMEKHKYFLEFPFYLIGTTYDLLKARKVDFLNNKEMFSSVCVPSIPFVREKYKARQELGLPQDNFILMCGAVSINSRSKGFKELVESINKFSLQICDKKSVSLLVVGGHLPQIDWPSNINVIKTGFLDLNGLFTCYYASDLYLSPSILDSGPMMVNYAIACGRPVVAFEVGIALDLVLQCKTGWLAPLQNTDKFAEGINYFYNLPKEEMSTIERNCLSHINSYINKPWYSNFLNKEK